MKSPNKFEISLGYVRIMKSPKGFPGMIDLFFFEFQTDLIFFKSPSIRRWEVDTKSVVSNGGNQHEKKNTESSWVSPGTNGYAQATVSRIPTKTMNVKLIILDE